MFLKATINGKLVCVEEGGSDNIGRVNARTDPASPGAWENLHIERLNNGKIALYLTTDGVNRYFSAQPDGSLVCNRTTADAPDSIPDNLRTAIGGYEECEEVPGPDGTVGYRFWTGFLCCELALPIEALNEDGTVAWSGHTVVANRAEMGSYEQFQKIGDGDGVQPVPGDRMNFRASMCSTRDGAGVVVFDPIYFGTAWVAGWRDRIDACLDDKRRRGITAVLLAVQGGYRDYLNGETFDFHANPSELNLLARYVRDRGFVPIIMVGTADGGTDREIYDGTMQRVCDALKELATSAWFCAGYEQNMDRGGGYTAKNMDDALLLMRRRLGPDAKLLLWLQPNRCTPASYWGSDFTAKPHAPIPIRWIGTPPRDGAWIDADDPYEGQEQGAFYVSGGLEIDGVWYQTPHGADGPSYVGGGPGTDGHGQPRYIDRVIECCDRFLPRGTPMPGAAGHIDGSGHVHGPVCPSWSAPDWFARERPRGRPVFIVGETVPYEYIRDQQGRATGNPPGQCSDDAVRACCRLVASVGVVVQGCWQ